MRIDRNELIERLKKERIAYGQVNGMRGFSQHPALKRVPVKVVASGETVMSVAAPARFNGEPRIQGEAPEYGQHNEAIRKEFAAYTDPLDLVASQATDTASLKAQLDDPVKPQAYASTPPTPAGKQQTSHSVTK